MLYNKEIHVTLVIASVDAYILDNRRPSVDAVLRPTTCKQPKQNAMQGNPTGFVEPHQWSARLGRAKLAFGPMSVKQALGQFVFACTYQYVVERRPQYM